MASKEFKRWLAAKRATFKTGKRSQIKVYLALVEANKETTPPPGVTMFQYPVSLKEDTNGSFVVTFTDIPEAITQGGSWEEALDAAQDALETALDFYFEANRQVPTPSPVRRGQPVVELPASLSAKVLLLNEMIGQGVRPAELARRLNTTPQEVNRLTNVQHTTRIDRIAEALKVLGKRLDIRAV